MLKPFFFYFGGKYRAALSYPIPKHGIIVEPFAGAAGYSVRHADIKVHLFDVDPIIVGIWQYLISASSEEVLRLPTRIYHVDEIHAPQEAKWLVGFWINQGVSQPRKQLSAWARNPLRVANAPFRTWSEPVKHRIAAQLPFIRHWRISQRSFNAIEPASQLATWFIDPPYSGPSGNNYRFGSKLIDYQVLSLWCKARRGRVIVCEQAGASWLPFSTHKTVKTLSSSCGGQYTSEVIWTKDVV